MLEGYSGVKMMKCGQHAGLHCIVTVLTGVDSYALTILLFVLLLRRGMKLSSDESESSSDMEYSSVSAVNAPSSRFGEFPNTMEKIKKQKKLYNAYKKLICSVLTLFANVDNAGSESTAPCYEDSSGAANSDTGDTEGENSELESILGSTRKEGEESVLKKAALDIIEVEAKLADFPLLDGLKRDVDRAKDTLANDDKVGVQLLNYFKILSGYLKSLDVAGLQNGAVEKQVDELGGGMALRKEIRRSAEAGGTLA
ncbi:hypothetical protein HPB50_012771 [Hyalomma asiaticum]|uniref:Uncharacterized protein n=1 Tax=Hyalomma asiaticum TaxID=266040 RepID=A0ACB7RRV6_HYAAI|nr:hypothetical protein HPB50_012771 [Hyalomma asiaticum]